jgi:aryl-alcohol dehydrogenase-like predicted oxidoreductase/histidinol phosphatase-like enzyme
MRLSTAAGRDEETAIAVIQAALDEGAVLLDTADAYCRDESERGHNERLIAEALRTWHGDRSRARVATKGGLRRPGGRWVPDGRARHLREACEASCRALGVEAIDIYQLHAPDPRTRFETSIRALASMRDEGLVRNVGLCNVTVGQIESARSIVEIAAVQASMSAYDDSALRNGVAEYCRDHGITLIAYRPLGGERAERLSGHEALRDVAARHGATAQQVALAWLRDLAPTVLPIPGCTRVETARSSARAAGFRLTDADRIILDAAFAAGRNLRVPRNRRMPPADVAGEVVIVMGAPGAGKSSVAHELTGQDYGRLNRDERGGTLSQLVSALDAGLAAGRRHWVLDNTYPSRQSRNEVIECAWSHGVHVRCIQVTTSTADAQINAIDRMLDLHGRLPTPDELSERGRADARWFGPDAQFRYERQLEPPVPDEGFVRIDRLSFERVSRDADGRPAVFFEFDDVLFAGSDVDDIPVRPEDLRLLPGRRECLAMLREEGRALLAIAWRPQVGAGEVDEPTVRATFERARDMMGVEIGIAFCPHVAGPPVCWCRKPLPGLVLEFARQRQVALEKSLLVGRAPADRTLAERLRLEYVPHEDFFDAE